MDIDHKSLKIITQQPPDVSVIKNLFGQTTWAKQRKEEEISIFNT